MSYALAGYSIRLANAANLLAEVNERSSHRVPTPRVGGIGLVAGMAVGIAALLVPLLAGVSLPTFYQLSLGRPATVSLSLVLAFALPVALAFALGYWDDRSNPPALAKLVAQFAIAAIPPALGLRLSTFDVPWGGPIALPAPVGFLVSFGWILFVMNAVNFMDGTNGLAGSFAKYTATFVLLLATNIAGAETLIPLAAGLLGASLGFLPWNYPKAKTFMGDCGSQPLGAFVAILGLHVATLPGARYPFIGYAMIVSVFLFDVAFTLGRRALRGANLLSAHREHLYQRVLVAAGESHEVVLSYVTGHLFLAGLAGIFYARTASPVTRWVALALCAGVLASYLAGTWKAEAQARRKAT